MLLPPSLQQCKDIQTGLTTMHRSPQVQLDRRMDSLYQGKGHVASSSQISTGVMMAGSSVAVPLKSESSMGASASSSTSLLRGAKRVAISIQDGAPASVRAGKLMPSRHNESTQPRDGPGFVSRAMSSSEGKPAVVGTLRGDTMQSAQSGKCCLPTMGVKQEEKASQGEVSFEVANSALAAARDGHLKTERVSPRTASSPEEISSTNADIGSEVYGGRSNKRRRLKIGGRSNRHVKQENSQQSTQVIASSQLQDQDSDKLETARRLAEMVNRS